MYCEICKKDVGILGRHLCKTHKDLDPKDYYDKYLKKPGEGVCPTCGKETKFKKLSFGYYIYCCNACVSANPLIKKRKEETCLSHFGCRHPLQNKEIVKKFHTNEYSNKLSTGIEAAYAKIRENEDLYDEWCKNRKENYIKTLQKTYGRNIINISQLQEVKDKVRKTYNNNFFRKNSYLYDDIVFDSGWELAYYIWLTDNNIEFEYHPDVNFEYNDNGRIRHYYPDFKIKDEYIEIKGDMLLADGKYKMTEAKLQCILLNTTLVTRKEMKPILRYVYNKYGKDYIRKYKLVKEIDSETGKKKDKFFATTMTVRDE